MKNIILLLLLTSLLFSQNNSFSKSKKQLRVIYRDHQTTIYCDCKYNYKDKSNMIDKSSCGYQPRNPYTKKGKINQRAKRIEWEHIIPAENFGRQFFCWREGDAQCVRANGKAYKGRKCCEKVNETYKTMQSDMHNLYPAIGELNADRSNFRFDFESPNQKQYGECKFSVDFKAKRAKVSESIRGIIARTYLYFNEQYKMKLSQQELKKYKAWNKMYPPDTWEIERNIRIEKMQGNQNQFIKKGF
jgi:deoxyribonuclease-1